VLFGLRTKRVINIDADPTTTMIPIKDEGDLYRITEISGMLDVDEKVLLVIAQSKIRLVGLPFSSNIIYATDRRIILRDISLHGLKENNMGIPYTIITDIAHKQGFISSSIKLKVNRMRGENGLTILGQYGVTGNEIEWIIEHLPNAKAVRLVKIVRAMISKWELLCEDQQPIADSNEHTAASFSKLDSPVDELLKIARLKNEGVLTEQEFIMLKQNIIERFH
jgi:hypothetical protein